MLWLMLMIPVSASNEDVVENGEVISMCSLPHNLSTIT